MKDVKYALSCTGFRDWVPEVAGIHIRMRPE